MSRNTFVAVTASVAVKSRYILPASGSNVLKINAFLFFLTSFRAAKDALHVQKVIDNARIPKDKGECVLQ